MQCIRELVPKRCRAPDGGWPQASPTDVTGFTPVTAPYFRKVRQRLGQKNRNLGARMFTMFTMTCTISRARSGPWRLEASTV